MSIYPKVLIVDDNEDLILAKGKDMSISDPNDNHYTREFQEMCISATVRQVGYTLVYRLMNLNQTKLNRFKDIFSDIFEISE